MLNAAGKAYGDILREYRKKKGMSQEQVGLIAGVKKNAVGAWEAGRSRPDVASIPALCRALELPINVFFGLSDDPIAEDIYQRYSRLNPYNRQVILTQMDSLYELQSPFSAKVVRLFQNDLSASAGPNSQLNDLSGLDKYKPQDCSTLVSVRNGSGIYGGSSGSLEGYNGDVKPNTRLYTLLDVANNGNSLDYMQSHDYPTVYSKKYGKGTKPPYLDGYGWRIFKNTYCGCCTSGPTTWYKRIGINLTWWNSKSVATSEHVTTRKWFKGNGFNMVWHGHLSDAEKLPTSSFCPGDVATFHVYDSRGRATSHGVMWTGKDWRSDCIQRALSCYPGGKDRDGNYSVCIWRMPSLVSEGLGINNTPDLT